jgi:ATP-dependent RNA helicase RhlE
MPRKQTCVTSFYALGLTDDVNRAISESGYVEPTEIQSQLIPIIRDGRDAIGLSQTGSGKTAAFVLPLLDHLVRSKQRAPRGCCSVLVLSPTRELSNQIADTVRGYGKYVNYAQAIIVGGVSYPPQIKALKRGVDIVIATPGRILDHIENDVIAMDETTVFVLDEADQMLDFGFLPVIRKIMAKLPKKRQTILLSATMPKAIKDLTRDFMTDPATIEATPESRPVGTVDQQIIYVEKPRKNMALLEIVSAKDVDRAIVFTRTKFGADRVQRFLNSYGILAVSLHGNKSQGQRQRALGQFRSGEATVLVATDIAGRGIDINDVSHVINVDLPNIPESYVHRIGRTARAGRQGVAISFCSRAERGFLKDIEKLIGSSLPKREDQPGEDVPSVSAEPVNMDKGIRDAGRSRKPRGFKGRGGKERGAGERSRRARRRSSAEQSSGRPANKPFLKKSRGPKPDGRKPKSDLGNAEQLREHQSREDRPDREDKPKRDNRNKFFGKKASGKKSISKSNRRPQQGKSSSGHRKFATSAEQGLKRKKR